MSFYKHGSPDCACKGNFASGCCDSCCVSENIRQEDSCVVIDDDDGLCQALEISSCTCDSDVQSTQ